VSTYTAFKTSEKLETEGIIIDYGDGGKYIVARMGGSNKKFTKRISKLTKPHRKAIQADRMDEGLAEQLLLEAFIDTCLYDWENVTDVDGEPLEYTRENALTLLTDLPELWDDLRTSAQNASLFRDEVATADSGN